ncbi:hypothetical protein A2U01_0089150, partial [Trifolium medium]|nr:hypothetical protein [Trifolium medium]
MTPSPDLGRRTVSANSESTLPSLLHLSLTR